VNMSAEIKTWTDPWGGSIAVPRPIRAGKPRRAGLTAVIDKHLGVATAKELIDTAGPHIDVIKLTSATSMFYRESILREKIAIYRAAEVEVMPGGTLGEVALWRDCFDKYLMKARELGFTAIEVSDGTITMSPQLRRMAIETAVGHGFNVVSEIGRKEWSEGVAIEKMAEQVRSDLAWGVNKVVIEAMEFGVNVGILDEKGEVCVSDMQALVEAAEGAEHIIWEAPRRQQQEFFISHFGCDANLGNIPPEEVLVVEATRRALTGMPFRDEYIRSLRGFPSQIDGI
jgi:phosphosulfolactate synthase